MGDNRLIYISSIFSSWRQRDKIETLMMEFNFVNKMLFRVMKSIMSTKSKQAMTNSFVDGIEMSMIQICFVDL